MAERRRLARDPLGLRRALADRLLIGLVAAMALLAALALAGRAGADGLAQRWREGAQAAVTVQIPQPTPERMDRALAALRRDFGIDSPRIAVFTSCGFEGTKVFLTPEQARDLAAQIRLSADAVDQGHRTLVQH